MYYHVSFKHLQIQMHQFLVLLEFSSLTVLAIAKKRQTSKWIFPIGSVGIVRKQLCSIQTFTSALSSTFTCYEEQIEFMHFCLIKRRKVCFLGAIFRLFKTT